MIGFSNRDASGHIQFVDPREDLRPSEVRLAEQHDKAKSSPISFVFAAKDEYTRLSAGFNTVGHFTLRTTGRPSTDGCRIRGKEQSTRASTISHCSSSATVVLQIAKMNPCSCSLCRSERWISSSCCSRGEPTRHRYGCSLREGTLPRSAQTYFSEQRFRFAVVRGL